jgi:hypothetical protein
MTGPPTWARSFPTLRPARVLLFTDGLSNFGAQRLPSVDVPLYAISAAARADAVMLRHAAEAQRRTLHRPDDDRGRDAADALLSESTRVVALDADGASQLVAASPFPRSAGWPSPVS